MNGDSTGPAEPTSDAEYRERAASVFHLYRSTTCKHKLHGQRCRRRCKWCRAECWCRCHGRWGLVRALARALATACERGRNKLRPHRHHRGEPECLKLQAG